MSAFVVAHVIIKNPEKFQAYAGGASATIAEHGGELMLRGQANSVLSGEHGHKAIAVIKFPNKEANNKWFNSPAYQALIPNRDEGADVVLVSYDEPQS
jgi:uncharacterized protein (DUF1330 family)